MTVNQQNRYPLRSRVVRLESQEEEKVEVEQDNNLPDRQVQNREVQDTEESASDPILRRID